jgi:hypothetical protein
MYHITFPQQSNRAGWIFVGQISDLNDNLLDLSSLSLEFAVRDKDGCQRLFASTDNGKMTVIGLGLFRWAFTKNEMRGLCRGTYDTGMTMADANDQTVQLSVGPLPIIDGNTP